MSRGLPFRIKATVQHRADAHVYLQAPGDAVLVKRSRARGLVMVCPCGCSDQLFIGLDRRAGPAWRLYEGLVPEKEASLFPSVWRESGCESHFIIWRGQILLFGKWDEEFDVPPDGGSEVLTKLVLRSLRIDSYRKYDDIAEELDLIPWDVQSICRRLVHSGKVREGTGNHKGWFRLT